MRRTWMVDRAGRYLDDQVTAVHAGHGADGRAHQLDLGAGEALPGGGIDDPPGDLARRRGILRADSGDRGSHGRVSEAVASYGVVVGVEGSCMGWAPGFALAAPVSSVTQVSDSPRICNRHVTESSGGENAARPDSRRGLRPPPLPSGPGLCNVASNVLVFSFPQGCGQSPSGGVTSDDRPANPLRGPLRGGACAAVGRACLRAHRRRRLRRKWHPDVPGCADRRVVAVLSAGAGHAGGLRAASPARVAVVRGTARDGAFGPAKSRTRRPGDAGGAGFPLHARDAERG